MDVWQSTNSDFKCEDVALKIDRRARVRSAPIVDGIQVWVDGDRRVSAELMDASDRGIGIVLPADVSFEFGPIVYVDYEGARRKATVAHVTQREDGLRLGLEWTL